MTDTATPSTSTAAPSTNVATTQRIYEAFGAGDVDTILGLLADDVRWEDWGGGNTAQQRGVPTMARRDGHAGTLEFLQLFAGLQLHAFEVRGFFEGQDAVVAEVYIDVSTPNGGRYADEELIVFRFNGDGRVGSIRHYTDTAKHAAAWGC
jgi:ketosteroid isomerase-like protein